MTKKKEKKPVFDVLFENNACFAVCIALNRFISRGIKDSSKDYFIIINKCDANRIKELTFYPTEGYKQVCERSLTADEIRIFKKDKDKFIQVVSNENGRVYELKENSFKVAYDSIRKKLRCF